MRESTLWLLHLTAGAAMLFLLGVHYGVMHLGGLFGIPREQVLTFASVQGRTGQPFYLVVYLLLLTAALYHGIYGLRSMLAEYEGIGPGARKAINFLLQFSGWVFFCYGAYTIIAGFMLS